MNLYELCVGMTPKNDEKLKQVFLMHPNYVLCKIRVIDCSHCCIN